MVMRVVGLGILCLLMMAPGAADAVGAEQFKLTYRYSFDRILEADIIGELQEDGDTVIVSAVENARLDGVAGPPLPFVTSLSDLVNGTNGNKPVLTLSGTKNDISMCSDSSCTGEFISFDGVMQFLGMPGIYTTSAYGSTYSGGANAGEKYDAANFRLIQIQEI